MYDLSPAIYVPLTTQNDRWTRLWDACEQLEQPGEGYLHEFSVDLDEAGTRHRSRDSRSDVSGDASGDAIPILPVSPTVAYRGVRRDRDADSLHPRLFNTPLCNAAAIVAGKGDPTDKSLA